MLSTIRKTRLLTTRRELVLLMMASMAAVMLLAFAVTRPALLTPTVLAAETIVLAALIAAAGILAMILVWQTTVRARAAAKASRAHIAELKRDLESAKAIINAEPQLLFYWERGAGLDVAAQHLEDVPGVPDAPEDILNFDSWLTPDTATALRDHMKALFDRGRGFNIFVRTRANCQLEADGRASAGRAVIRLRAVAGYKRELSRIIEHQSELDRKANASRALVNALQFPAWLKDGSDAVTWVNDAYVKAVEADSVRDVLDNQIELLEQQQRKRLQKSLGESGRFEQRMHLNISGKRKAHDVIAISAEDHLAVAAIDVADLEFVKGELAKQVTAFERTLDRVTTAVAIYDRDDRLSYANAAFQFLWALDAGWIETKPSIANVFDRLNDRGLLPDATNYRSWRDKFLSAARGADDQDDYWHLPDGRVLHVIVEKRSDGGVTHLYVDETERFALETRFNSLNRVQGETLNSLTEGVVVFGTDGRIKLFNTAFTQLWHISAQTLEAQPHIEHLVDLARNLFDGPDVWAEITRSVTAFSDERHKLSGQMQRPDHSIIDYAALPLPDGGTLLTFADVTKVRRYERTLLERNVALEAADELKNQFISHVSYELRTPLTTIMGFLDVMAQEIGGPLTERQKEYLADMTTSSEQLKSRIDDIIDLTQIDADGLSIDKNTKPADVIAETIRAVEKRAKDAGLMLDVAIADDIGVCNIDASRMAKVLAHVMSNAIGFSKSGDTVMLTAWRQDNDILFQIEDTGVGIPRTDQAKVFDRFHSKSYGMKHRGVGLGLSMVQSTVALHHGDVVLVSEPGVGTCVTIRIPDRHVAAGTGALDATAPAGQAAQLQAAADKMNRAVLDDTAFG